MPRMFVLFLLLFFLACSRTAAQPVSIRVVGEVDVVRPSDAAAGSSVFVPPDVNVGSVFEMEFTYDPTTLVNRTELNGALILTDVFSGDEVPGHSFEYLGTLDGEHILEGNTDPLLGRLSGPAVEMQNNGVTKLQYEFDVSNPTTFPWPFAYTRVELEFEDADQIAFNDGWQHPPQLSLSPFEDRSFRIHGHTSVVGAAIGAVMPSYTISGRLTDVLVSVPEPMCMLPLGAIMLVGFVRRSAMAKRAEFNQQ